MKIKEGSILVYYLFDVASEIQVEKLEKVMGKKPVESQISYTRVTPKYIQYSPAPYLLKFGKKQMDIDGKKLEFEVFAKIFEFGVISMRFDMLYSGELDNLEEISQMLSGNLVLENEAIKYVNKIKKEIPDLVIKPLEKYFIEDYIIFHAKSFDKAATAKEVMKEKNTIAKILRSEGKVDLSPEEVDRTVTNTLSYFPDDLAIVDWNSAFIYDPRMSWDTLDVLEYANIELLELRTYDSVLDKELDSAYDKMKVKGWRLPLLSPFSSAIQRLEETRLEVTEVTEKVENALKLVGDQYLANVYNTAVEALFLNEWKKGVKDKLEIIDDFYSTLYNKVQTERMLVLETLIVLLIVLEILIAFWPK